MIWPKYLNSRSQDLKPAYHDSGSFYWVKSNLSVWNIVFAENAQNF